MPEESYSIDIHPLETHHFDCVCYSPEHSLRFTIDQDDKILYTEVYLNQYRNLFKRIWCAIKYVFGYTSHYGHWDCFTLNPLEVQRLHDMTARLLVLQPPETLDENGNRN